jgi:hypothetical protein
MLIERENKLRGAQSRAALPRFVRELRQHEVGRQYHTSTERTKAEQKIEDAGRFTALVESSGADLRALHELGMKTHGIDPRWAKALHERATKSVAELVRLIDQDADEGLPPIGDAVVEASVSRMRIARSKAAITAGIMDND